jgi:hypothetical protein
MKQPKTIIDGYTVEMMQYDETINCYISKGSYSASLAALQDTGELTNDSREITVHPQTVAAIEQWAEDNGY